MIIENNTFYKFKSYPKNYGSEKPKKSLAPVAGAALGTIGAFVLSSKIIKNKETSGIKQAADMITMAAGANIGGVLAGSINAKPDSIKRKWKEAAFQLMNMSIPMMLVTLALETCKKVKALNNNPAKIIGSIIGMVGGAFLATQITNLTKNANEPKRKYTIKDSIANFDDIIATIKIGFPEIEKIVPVGKILPFIYTYSGARAGWKE